VTVPGQRIRDQLVDQAQRGDVYAPECPSRSLLDHVSSRWGVLVLVLLLDRPHRFSELAGTILGVSDKMLSQTLKVLVADGFVERVVAADTPVRVSYQLTPNGHEVAARLAELVEWLEGNVGAVLAARPSAA
jgi:DNA-binding HxlR family transcriptional regulator